MKILVKDKYNYNFNIINIKTNSIKGVHVKNCTYYFPDDMINTKNLDLNKIKIEKKWYKNYYKILNYKLVINYYYQL